jgi:Icc-related predicted phosphoesterase
MIIDCIADLHGFFPELEGGDLLIVAGDITASDTVPQLKAFFDWFEVQKYRKKVLIGGNHDNFLANSLSTSTAKKLGLDGMDLGQNEYEYLLDSGTEFEGLKIWGSPWTPWFYGVHPKCKAFMVSEAELDKKFTLIPANTDILVTHGPPFGCLDKNVEGTHCGSTSLADRIFELNFKLHVFGHIHEAYGQCAEGYMIEGEKETAFGGLHVNCSYVNYHYKPVNKPVRVIL